MSDDQLNLEWKLQRRLREALGELRSTIDEINDGSAVTHIRLQGFLDFCHDEMPTEHSWDEKIAEARRG